MKKVCTGLLFILSACIIFPCAAQSILDSCYTSATPSVSFTGTATLTDAYDADLLEWTGAAWNGAWPGANVTLPPPCNTPPVRAVWIGDSAVWTTGGEAFGLKFSPPLTAGTTYHFFFTYVSVGLGSNGAFAPSVFTNNTGSNGGNYAGDFIPAGFAWETHPFTFTATPVQAGDDFLIIHSYDGSGMVLNLCAETLTDLGDDSLTICFGDSAILFAGNGFQSYSWSTGETTQQITVQNPGTYISTNQGFCGTSSDTIVISVDPCGQFPVAIFTTPDNHICPGTCTGFTNLSQNASSYQWTFAGASPGTSTDVDPALVCYNTPGTYAVELIATNGLTSDTLSLNNFITVYPFPPPQGILQSGDTLFANQGSQTYQWYFNGTLIPGATAYYFIATQSGDYNVVCADGDGCEVEAVINDVVAGYASLHTGNEPLRIFPNPVRDKLFIGQELPAGASAEIVITNVLGASVTTREFTPDASNKITMDAGAWSPGLYFIELKTPLKSWRSKFIKD